MKIVYRAPRPEERAFIVSTWRASFKRSPYGGLIRASRWKETMEREINDVLDAPATRALVVADPTVSDGIADLFGHLVWQPSRELERCTWNEPDMQRTRIVGTMPLVFYCYVKRDYRERGFARGLMRAAGIEPGSVYNFVCRTYATDKLIDAGKLPRARWRPLLGRATEGNHEHDRDDETAIDP